MKIKAIHRQSPLWIRIEHHGMEEWSEHNQAVTLPSLVGV